MKRSLILGVVLLAVLLLFSGCDQILEIFYPELVDNNAGYGNYRIKINGQVDYSVTWADAWANHTAPVRAGAIPYYETANGLIMAKDEIWVQEYWGQETGFTLEFYPLKQALYKVIVWFDENNDGIPNYGEPSLLAGWMTPQSGFNTIFDFTSPDIPATVDATVMLRGGDQAPPDVLDTLNQGGGPQTDYRFWVSGATIFNASAPASMGYKIYPNDPNLSVSKVDWQLRDWYGTILASSTQWGLSPIWISFPASAVGTLYTITFNVVYGDAANGQLSQDYSVEAVNEATNSTAYHLWASIKNLGAPPVWLDDSSHNFFFHVVSTNNSWFGDPSDLAFGSSDITVQPSYEGSTVISYGAVWDAHVGLGYDMYRASSAQKGVQAVIDMDNNGYISSGDWVSVYKPVHLTTDDWNGTDWNCKLTFDGTTDFYYVN